MVLISSVQWVPRGVSQGLLQKYEPSAGDLEDYEELRGGPGAGGGTAPGAQSSASAAVRTALAAASEAAGDDNIYQEFDLDHYDDDENDPLHGTGAADDDTAGAAAMRLLGAGGAEVVAPEDDPYMTIKDEDDSDIEDEKILETDNLLLAGKTDEELSSMEVHVFEEDDSNMFVHHEYLLPTFPLCIEWLDYVPGTTQDSASGSFAAVGTFAPEVELWNLNIEDSVHPDVVLGGVARNQGEQDPSSDAQSKKKKKKKKKKQDGNLVAKLEDGSHTDAIMSLSWNRLHRSLLVSSSADRTVKLWDLEKLTCAQTYSHHQDKVSSVSWHPTEGTLLLSGSFDKTAALFDARAATSVMSLKATTDIESTCFLPLASSTLVLAGCDDGHVLAFDPKMPQQPRFTVSAHSKGVSKVRANPAYPGLFATCSEDRYVRCWAATDTCDMVGSKKAGIGAIFDVSWCPDAPYLLAAVGASGTPKVWNTSECSMIRERFAIDRKNGPALISSMGSSGDGHDGEGGMQDFLGGDASSSGSDDDSDAHSDAMDDDSDDE